MSQPVSKADVDQLVRALNRLSIVLESVAASGSSSRSLSATISIAGWELVEPPSEHVELESRIIFEDGPQPVPEDLLVLAAGKLSTVADHPKDRVLRAWRAVFWAWAAVATHTEDRRAEGISWSDTQWIIVNHSRVFGPIRVRKLSDLRQLLASQVPALQLLAVHQGFESLTEIQVFCASYRH